MLKTINNGKLPTRGSKYSAFVDLYANEDVVIGAGETKIVKLGVCISQGTNMILGMGIIRDSKFSLDNFLKSHYLQLEPRSSLRAKGLIADTGIIDLDYEDEIGIIIHNPYTYKETFKIASTVSIASICASSGGNMDKVAEKIDEFDKMYDGDTDYTIKKGDRIAQISLMEHKSYLMGISSDKVRDGGYGSAD